MTQSVVVQVGQCGNQVGCRFWDLALREHAHVNKRGLYDEALGSFFRNVDTRKSDGGTCCVGDRIHHLKARAVLVDMEEGVVNQILQGPLREVFDSTQLLTDVSGSGNNWAAGYMTYGSAYRESIVDKLRKASEHCDCLQCFFLIHSMGGGTGSGLGTRVLSLLEEEFPDVCRIVTSMYPSLDDDVITSPYNSVLAMRELTEHADCVLPVENQSLMDIVNKINVMSHGGKPGSVVRSDSTITSGRGGLSGAEKPFDAMNNIVANLLLNITRYEVKNVLQHPTYAIFAVVSVETFQAESFGLSSFRLRPTLPFVSWNQEAWKTGLCSVPPVGHAHSLLALANNTCVKPTFMELRERFTKLYKKKAHLHHYLHVDGMEQSVFDEAFSSLSSLIEEYHHLDATKARLIPDAPRLCIAT
ncbi:tubulin epsilon chain [Austrofundulus limnaeus]|uniref:Tubulin epsilon chain n=1 Tax=Austrofundulus limnaeus TaxID=52670 RepID=A0AC58RKB9_AUSLI